MESACAISMTASAMGFALAVEHIADDGDMLARRFAIATDGVNRLFNGKQYCSGQRP